MSALVRFFLSLRLLVACLPAVLACIFLASFLPQVFLWYVGEVSACGVLRQCEAKVFGLSWAPSVGVSPLGLVGLVAVAVAFRIVAWVLFEVLGQLSSQRLSTLMTKSLASTRVTWFDTRDSGSLLARFSHDYTDLKQMGVIRIGDTLNAVFEVVCLASLVLLADPIPFLLLAPVLVVFLWLVARIGRALADTKTRLSKAMATFLHRGTDFIDGAWTFLVYGKAAAVRARLHAATAEVTDANVALATTMAKGRSWADAVSAVYGSLFLLFVVISLSQGRLEQSVAAVLLTTVFRLQPAFNWLLWSTAYLKETDAGARRVFEIVDLPAEETEEFAPGYAGPARTRGKEGMGAPDTRTNALPREGDIALLGFTASYRPDTPPVLAAVDLVIPQGARVGIVGRTGAGKSTLFQALLRMLHVHAGDVRIGGVSIYAVPPAEVRSLFCVVPQSPYLFGGTVRENLDFTSRSDDDALARALATVGLALPLDAAVKEGGANLSVGERQLLCLARALVTDKRIILMDEPTSSVDPVTDARIQELLGSVFRGRTVVTIAHRVGTLEGYDRVIDLGALRDARGTSG